MSEYGNSGSNEMRDMRTDLTLLRQYVEERNEAAFAELVHRHLDMVWGVACRITKDEDLARDVAQGVFSDLARKGSRLPPTIVLAAWLHRAASLAAKKCVRTYVRRSERERKAMDLHSPTTESTTAPETDTLLPILDEGLESLPTRDRTAIMLRFFGQKSFAEVGDQLGVSDDTAQKRVSRAIQKLRVYFRKKGAPVATKTITACLSAASASIAPAGFAQTVIVSSVGGISSLGATTLLIHKLQYQLLLMKTKVIVSVIAVSSATTPLLWQQQAIGALQEENKQLSRQLEPMSTIMTESAALSAVRLQASEFQRLEGTEAELESLRNEAARLAGPEWQERRDLFQDWSIKKQEWETAKETAARLQAEFDAQITSEHTRNAMLKLGLAARIWATDNDDTFPRSFVEMTNELANAYTEGFEGNLMIENFEWIPHARPVSEMEPQLALFREKTPRQLPDGTWERAYTLCDGSVQLFKSDSADFSKAEAHMIASKPTIPAQFKGHPAYNIQPITEKHAE